MVIRWRDFPEIVIIPSFTIVVVGAENSEESNFGNAKSPAAEARNGMECFGYEIGSADARCHDYA